MKKSKGFDEYMELFKGFGMDKNKEKIQKALDQTLGRIKFLESIYMTGGVNNVYSREFLDAAVREREDLCQCTSACHRLLINIDEAKALGE